MTEKTGELIRIEEYGWSACIGKTQSIVQATAPLPKRPRTCTIASGLRLPPVLKRPTSEKNAVRRLGIYTHIYPVCIVFGEFSGNIFTLIQDMTNNDTMTVTDHPSREGFLISTILLITIEL